MLCNMSFSESARSAEGTFRCLKTRHTQLFWEALTFIIVKGVADCMPPLLTVGNIDSNLPMPSSDTASVDVLGDMLQTLSFTPPCSSRTSSPSLILSSLSGSSPCPSTSQGEVSLLVYSHIRNLRGILSSNYYRTPTLRVGDLAQPLGPLAVRYLVSHGYGTSDITMIV